MKLLEHRKMLIHETGLPSQYFGDLALPHCILPNKKTLIKYFKNKYTHTSNIANGGEVIKLEKSHLSIPWHTIIWIPWQWRNKSIFENLCHGKTESYSKRLTLNTKQRVCTTESSKLIHTVCNTALKRVHVFPVIQQCFKGWEVWSFNFSNLSNQGIMHEPMYIKTISTKKVCTP